MTATATAPLLRCFVALWPDTAARDAIAKHGSSLMREARQETVVRGDSGFCTEEIMAWCEAQLGVYYCLGLSKNSVLIGKLTPALVRARIPEVAAPTQADAATESEAA